MTTPTGIRVALPGKGDSPDVQWVVSSLGADKRVPLPSLRYRHAAPSAPWPWMDFNHDVAHIPPLAPGDHEPWSQYPQSQFRNWSPDQVQRCQMLTVCKDEYSCQIHRVDVFKDGTFDRPDEKARTRRISSDPAVAKEFWNDLQKPVDHLRVRALFVENITSNVLKVLGTRYNIEPYFFASSANWIPSRYQEDLQDGKGDHITVILPFVRTAINQQVMASPTSSTDLLEYPLKKEPTRPPAADTKRTIDTQAPFVLSDQIILFQDLLAIHMVRNAESNTLISYHHHSDVQWTTAEFLRSLVQRTGDSVYWSKLYGKSKDPTLLFLAMLWYALYAWDEALEVLYEHLSEQLEVKATNVRRDTAHIRKLHTLQVHLLYYARLLCDFRKSVEFVRDTPNPAMSHESVSDSDRDNSQKLLALECGNLLDEIKRLERQREMQSDRLQNVMELAISTVHIEESKRMQEWTQAAIQNSSAVKIIEYLTIIFLPATYVASAFGMSIVELTPSMHAAGHGLTLAMYLKSTVILMLATVWAVIALHDHSAYHPGGRHIVRRIGWPIFYGYDHLRWMTTAVKKTLRGQWVADA